jgi:transposase
MSLARLVVAAVKEQGRTKSDVARDYRVSRRWVQTLCKRYEAQGDAGLEPRSRRPGASPHQTPVKVEEEIVELRKVLADQGLDAGAHTIAYHLAQRHQGVPSVATIWRILKRRGFVTLQPQKRPRSSFIRFCADQPNERCQADITHWVLADGSPADILNILDDHSRLLVGSDARATTKAGSTDRLGGSSAAASTSPAPCSGRLTDITRGRPCSS